jgi:catechol 2,3-dioxygenase-like lactoylglutathione lyase family enzyme
VEVVENRGLRHLHICVSDLDRSLRFYQGVFGMQEKFRDGPLVFLTTPGSEDSLTLNPDPARAGQRGGVDHFGFKLATKDDLDAAIATAEAHGGRLVERGEHAPGYPYAYVEDPDGYLVEF